MRSPLYKFEIHGHRGCRGLMPENTIPAFSKAIQLGVDYLELDVVISKDRKVVVSHEPFFNPVFSTRPDGKFVLSENETNLYLMNYDEIRSYEVGLRSHNGFPEQIKLSAFKPLLSEILQMVFEFEKSFDGQKVGLNIELKSLSSEYNISQPEPADFVDLVLEEVYSVEHQLDIVFQSFDFNVLQILNSHQKSSRNFKISVLIEPEDDNEIDSNLEKLGFKPDIWSPNFSVLSKTKVDYLHQKGIKVIPWTVNEIGDMSEMLDLGCDGIITDYPDRAIAFIKK